MRRSPRSRVSSQRYAQTWLTHDREPRVVRLRQPTMERCQPALEYCSHTATQTLRQPALECQQRCSRVGRRRLRVGSTQCRRRSGGSWRKLGTNGGRRRTNWTRCCTNWGVLRTFAPRWPDRCDTAGDFVFKAKLHFFGIFSSCKCYYFIIMYKK